jgi:hypothetical protein
MNAVNIKLPFGLDENNNFVHISNAERGKKCGCVCPSCKSPLIAAKGRIQHHFRHANDNESESCSESAIHLAAKDIILKKKQITLPNCVSIISEYDSKGKEHKEEEIVVQTGTVIYFDSVVAEKELYGMEADILAAKEGKELVIEIFYRHKVDEHKKEKIINANISAIEIDLSKLMYEDIKTPESFWAYISNPEHIQWLYNAREIGIKKDLEIKLKEKIQNIEEEYKNQERERKQQEEEKEKARLSDALEEIKDLSSEESIKILKQDAETYHQYKDYIKYLPFSWNELPSLLNIDVPDGDWIFGCDRRVWQITIYSFIISNKIGDCLSIKDADCWIRNNPYCEIPESIFIVLKYGRKYPKITPAYISKNLPSTWRTLKHYFDCLCHYKILEYADYDHYKRGNHWYRVIGNTHKCD